MPVAKIQLEDGRIARFEVPEGTTQEQVMAYVQQNKEQFAKQESKPQENQDNGLRFSFSDDQLTAIKAVNPQLGAVAQTLNNADLGRSGEFLRGAPEAALTMLTGAVAEPASGLAALSKLDSKSSLQDRVIDASLGPLGVFRKLSRATPEEIEIAGQSMSEVSEGGTFVPRSEAGKFTLKSTGEVVGEAIEPLSSAAEQAGRSTQDITGSPLAAAAVETTLKAAPELIGSRFAAAKPSVVRRSIPEPELVREARLASEQTGVDLFEGQQTLNPSTLERQSFVQQLPPGVQASSRALEAQNAQASSAVSRVLESIAPDESVFEGAERFRSASQRAIEARKQARAERSSPLYNQAFKEGAEVDVTDILDEFSAIADEFPETGSIRANINKALGYLDSNDLKRLHNAKLEIDELINSRGESSVGNTAKRQLIGIKEKLVERMAEASPKYEEARAAFEAASPDVRKLENSIIGKIANLDDTQLKSVAGKIFDQNSTVKNVNDAKAIIREVDPDAWDMLVRAELEKRLGGIKPGAGGSVENIPGKISDALFGIGKKRDIILAGIDGDAKKSMLALETALKRARLGREKGSQTASRSEISKELRGGLVSGLRDLFSRPLDTVVRTGEDAQFNRRVKALSEALFDPRYKAETAKYISSGRGKDLTRLVLSIEALRSSAEEETEAQRQARQAQQ